MSSAELSVVATAKPQPYGPVALAYHLESLPASSSKPASALRLSFQHSLSHAQAKDALLTVNGKETVGVYEIMKQLADSFADQGLCGSNKEESDEIATLIKAVPASPALPTATAWISSLEQRLTLRTFLVGHAMTLADWALWHGLKTNMIAQSLLAKAPHTLRWFNFMSLHPETVKAVDDLIAQSKIKPPKEKKVKDAEPTANTSFELGLPNAEKGKVVTRFPPEPSGYLHIGHAKAAILNMYFAKMYEGKLLIRFDDTNPSKEKAEFEQSIIEDLELLGIKGDRVSYTSDYLDQLQIYCVQLIKDGKAYADDTEQDKMRHERMNGIASERRDMPPEESLAKFAEMATGSEEGCRWCIRAKISFDNPNKAMRDPVIYRCNLLPHHRTGDKFKMYPTYDFACPVVDSLEGVTHALRTSEYRDRNPQYQWMLEATGVRKVEIWDYARINFTYTLLSKRKLKWFVEEGHVRGWDDPRFPTVRGIRRRGMTIEGLTQFMLLQGPSHAITNLEWDVIWTINKKIIDPVAPRYTAVDEKDVVKCVVSGSDCPAQPEVKAMPLHKKNPDVGEKQTTFSSEVLIDQEDAKSFEQDEEITLMDWGNAFVRKIEKNAAGTVTSLGLELHLAGDFKKTKKKVTWLGVASSRPLTPVALLDYDYLITKKKLEEDDDVADCLSKQTEFITPALADSNVAALKKGTIIQFERKGYFIVDKEAGQKSVTDPSDRGTQQVELILIPDGRAASVASKSAPVTAAAPAATGAKSEADGKKKQKKGGDAAVGSKKEPKANGPKTNAATGLPEIAPEQAVETFLKSEVNSGFDMPVKTKMFKVDNHYGAPPFETKTEMYPVKPVYEQ